jgi:hypothetical protein
MSEPSLERLSRFTPDAGGLDRDALLYVAGRRSARPNRAWIALAAALAVSQALTLALLWPRPAPPAVSPLPPPAVAPPAPELYEGTGESPGVWSIHHGLQDLERDDASRSTRAGTIEDSGPPLRAFGRLPSSILN